MAFPDELKRLVADVQSTTKSDVNLYFIERKKQRLDLVYEIYQTQIEDQVAPIFKNAFLGQLGEVLAQPDLQLVAYNPGVYDERPSLYTLPANQIPACQELLQKLAAHQSLDFPPRLTETFLKRLWAYAVVIETSDNEVIYFRKHTPSKVVREMGLIFEGGHFKPLGGEVFNIDQQVDCLCVDGQMYILNGSSFENIFGYREWHQQTAQATLQSLGAMGAFHGLESVAQGWTQNWRMARKLASIAKTGRLDKVDYARCRDLAQRYGLKITFDEQQRKIDLSTSDSWQVLKLLDDDYLTSPMTADDYEVNAKRRK
ncbi:MAG TPA: Kiwa anti-phage protein KwaB-like domain-containing protein [Symbiobacteriaceae bacterium]|nr:Kiwa anti-phage protein KwaB-like domain-containing protein [Symbiobacteriaceae bacterium]